MRRLAVPLVAACALSLPAAAAQAQVFSGYDGTNPFECTLQQAGRGTDFPDPDADPFCVEYEKRNQNVTELGLVQFLSLEPARVAAASPKCFYFQHDHWVGSVQQGNAQTQTYAWDGSYYFDKAKGTGGVYVENFSFNGQSGDPTQMPGFPEEYKPYFGQGRGGFQRSNAVPADLNCAAKASQKNPYRATGPGGAPVTRCRVPGGRVDRGIGGIRLGMTRKRVRKSLGQATTESSKYMTYCMDGGGRVVAAFNRTGAAGRVVLVLTNAGPFDARGVRPGSKASKARARFRRYTVIARRVIAVREKRQVLVAGLAKRRVAFLASASPRISAKRTARFLAKASR